MYCTNCGSKLDDNADICIKCGASVKKTNANNNEDVPNTGLNILSFLWPLVGLILYLVYNDKYPNKAKKCGKWALISFSISMGLTIILFVLFFLLSAN